MKRIVLVLAALALAGSVSAAEKSAAKSGKDPAKGGFTTTLSAGMTLTDGNSETLAANVSLKTEGEKEGLGSVLAGIEGNYGESTVADVNNTTVENAKGYVNVKKTLSERLFASLDGSVLYDDIALLDYRATLGPALGLYLVKSDKRNLTVEAGPSYVWEKKAGAGDDYLALRFSERYTCQITKTAKLFQSAEYVPAAEDFDNYLLTGEAGVEDAMSERLSLRVVLQDKYDSTPAAGAVYNDLSLIAGLGFAL